jgi:integrase
MPTRLQDQKIKGLKAPARGRPELKDAVVPGLMIRITPNGVKSFCLVFKVPGEHPDGPSKTGAPRKGKPHRMTLGTWPMLSLADARTQARLLLEQVDLGIDPRPVRLLDAREAYTNTVAAVAKRFVAQECKGHIKSWKRVERTLALHVLPALGQKPIGEVKRAEVNKLLDLLLDEDREGGPMPGAAKDVIKHMRHLFEFAVDRGIIESNPAHKLKRKILKSNGAAHRALDDAELRAIWKAADSLGYPYGPCIKLLMLTGARRNEWAEATRAEIDSEARTHNIPADRYKTGIPHSVPLTREAWEIVDALPIWNGGDFLFSTSGGVKAINSHGTAKKRIDKLTGPMANWTFHDFRVTAETRMAALGINPDHFEACLGHVKQGMQKVYNRHGYEVEKRAALGLYGRHILGIVK